MSDQPLRVSIIMPTYRRSHCIHDSIHTIQAQTYPHWELIISNNGPDRYEFQDPKIRVIDSSAVTSAAYARNQALPYATGDLVAFFDDDDALEPDYLASFVQVFESRPEVRMVKCLMIHEGVLNEAFGTPTVVMRRQHATPTWEPIRRQDRNYYAAIIARDRLSEANGTLVRIPRALIRSSGDPEGGLRAGNL